MSNTEGIINQKQEENSGLYKIQIKQKNIHIKKRKVKTWTNQQDKLLMKLYHDHPKKWGVISGLMKDRNQNQCLHRYRRLLNYGNQKKIWTPQQDQKISDFIKKVGKNWKALSQIIGTKTGKQIRQRFINKLDPNIKNEEWTEEEDQLILKYFTQFGSKWSQISKRLPGRPQNKIKNRYYSYIQKNYDIKYIKINEQEIKQKEEYNQSQKIIKKKMKQKKINKKNINQKTDQNNQVCNTNEIQVLSIKQIQPKENLNLEELNNDKQNQLDLHINFQQKYGLHSLIKVDDEIGEGQILDQRYRSIRSLASNNQFQNQNDLFYLSQL